MSPPATSRRGRERDRPDPGLRLALMAQQTRGLRRSESCGLSRSVSGSGALGPVASTSRTGPDLGKLASLRYAAFPALQIFALWTLLQGGMWTWGAGLLLAAALTVADLFIPDYRGENERPIPRYEEALIWLILVLSALLFVALFLYTASSGTPLGQVSAALGLHDGSMASKIGAVLSTGFILGSATPASHELFHRAGKFHWYTAQFAMAQYLYAPMAIEHIHGHHRNVGTPGDVTTAPRGLSFWRYFPRAIFGTYKGAARIEAERMQRASRSRLSWHNRFLQGVALQIVLLGFAFALGGVGAVAGMVVAGVIAILSVEAAQYVSHYGLVRVPNTPVENRHSWNSLGIISTTMMLNLQRHSAHHRNARRAYWDLNVPMDAPTYPAGVGLMGFLSLYPKGFFKVTEPLLKDWDRRFASPEERALLRKAEAGEAP